MNKLDLIQKTSKELGVSQRKALHIVNTFADILREAILQEDDICFHDFCTVKIISRKSRVCKNIRTKEEIYVPAYKEAKMVLCKKMKRELNK